MLHQDKSINIANLINKALYWSFFVQRKLCFAIIKPVVVGHELKNVIIELLFDFLTLNRKICLQTGK